MTATGESAGLIRSRADAVPHAGRRFVYCVPAAGTGARTFLGAHAGSPLSKQLRAVQLPGREDRLAEPCLDDIGDMSRLVAAAIAADLPRTGSPDYALFGHSFGAAVMLETARALEHMPVPAPAVLGVAACAPPHLPGVAPFDTMTSQQIYERLRRLGGLDFSGRLGAEMKDLVLPVLTADVRALARYLGLPGRPPVITPIIAMGGALDPAVPAESLAQWGRHSEAGLLVRMFPGGHFFPLASEGPLRAVLEWNRIP